MELIKYRNNAICGMVFLIFSLWMIFYAIPTQISLVEILGGADAGANSRSTPYFAAAFMGIPSLIQLLVSVAKYVRLEKQGAEAPGMQVGWTGEIRALIIFGLCIFYGVLFWSIGYILATVIVPPIMLFVLGDRKWRHYLSVYVGGPSCMWSFYTC